MISFPSTVISIISVSSGMFRKLRSIVPKFWVLVAIVTFSEQSLQASQFWNSEQQLIHGPVTSDSHSVNQFLSVYQCTVVRQSFDVGDIMAPNLTNEQNQVLKLLYKAGRKRVHLRSHVYFLNESLKLRFIPKRFHIKNNLPGCKLETQKQLDLASFLSVESERDLHKNNLEFTNQRFDQLKEHLYELFSPEAAFEEIKRLEKHLKKIEKSLTL